MNLHFVIYILLPVLSLFIGVMLAATIKRHYQTRGSNDLVIILLLSAGWSGISVFQHLNIQNSGFFWLKLSYLPISLIPVFWLLFTITFSHQKVFFGIKTKGILLLIPLITNIIIWLPNTQIIFWKEITVQILEGVTFFSTIKGTWYWIYLGYAYSLLMLGISVILIRINIYESLFKKQALGILAGFTTPFLANFLFNTKLLPFLADDITPTFMSLGGIIIMFSINITRLFNLIPEPPSAIFENSIDGILVLDPQFRIISANHAFDQLININLKRHIGDHIIDVFPYWKDQYQGFMNSSSTEGTSTFEVNDRMLEVRISHFQDTQKTRNGYLVYVRDVTEANTAHQEVLENYNKYISLFENMLTGAMIFTTKDQGENFVLSNINNYAEFGIDQKIEKIIGKNLKEIFSAKEFEVFIESVSNTLETGSAIKILPIKSQQAGISIWREFIVYPLSTNEVVIICKNNTEEMRAKEKLTLINKDLEMYVNQLEEFSTDILYLNQLGSKLQSSQTYQEVSNQVRHFSGKLFSEFLVNLVILNTSDQSVLYSDLENVGSLVNEYLPLPFLIGLPPKTFQEFCPADFEPYQTQQNNQSVDANKFPFLFFVCNFAEGKMVILTVNTQSRGLEQKQRQHLLSICERLMLTLSNINLQEQLKYEALHDEITGFYNRRFMNESLPREFHRAERYQRPLSFIMLDVDHFKQFNDTYGHILGDQVLKKISEAIQSMIRKSDLVFRYGGEEFLIVLPETDLAEALDKAQIIAKMIRSIQVEWNHETINALSISGGVSNYPIDAQSIEELISCADEAMYKAKDNGRDQIFVYAQKSSPNSNSRLW